jgi:hypothetical protein
MAQQSLTLVGNGNALFGVGLWLVDWVALSHGITLTYLSYTLQGLESERVNTYASSRFQITLLMIGAPIIVRLLGGKLLIKV